MPNPQYKTGIEIIKTFKKKICNWVEMEFDAKVVKHGVTWLRVKDGMGGRGDRDDWVADLPDACICVHDYNWTTQNFGHNYGSFDAACLGELKRGLERQNYEVKELTQKLDKARKGLVRLREVIDNA